MINEFQVQSFEDRIRDHLPGTIWIFDIADFKRFNLHLGFDAGNIAIAELEVLLQKAFKAPDHAHRVAGDKWFAFQKMLNLDAVTNVLTEFSKDYTKEVGWDCVATSVEGLEKTAGERMTSKVTLRARAGYRPADMFEPLESGIEHLVEWIHLAEVGKPENMTSIPAKKRSTYVSAQDVSTTHHCPFCLGNLFGNGEGRSDGFLGDCRKCGARCVFKFL